MRDRVRRLAQALSARVRRKRRDESPPVAVRSDGPLLSVIVVGAGDAVADHVAECLDSLARQTLRRLQIILVDDVVGAAHQQLAAFAARDPRAVVLAEAAASPGAARHAGAEAATAPYLTFLNAADIVPPDGYRRLVMALEESGSDVAAGAVRRDRNGKRTTPAWSSAAHHDQVLATTVDESPIALQDLFLGNRVFRRDFWRAAVGPLRVDPAFDDAVPSAYWNERMAPYGEGVAYDDHLPVLAASLRARRLDLITAVTCIWRVRERAGPSTIDDVGELSARLAVLHEARQLVVAEGSVRAVDAWTGRVLSVELPVFIRHALAADDRYRSTLRAAAVEFLGDAGAEALADTPVDRKLLVALAAAGRWDEADALLETVRLDGPIPPTSIVDGRVYADLPCGNGFGAEILELSREQTRLAVVLDGLRWDPAGALTIEGWSLVHGVDLGTTSPELEIDIVEPGGAGAIRLDVTSRFTPEATRWADDPWQRYDHAGFRVVIPLSALQPPGSRKGSADARRWRLRVRLIADGVTREGFARTLTRFGTADRLPSSPVLDVTDPRRVLCLFDDDEGFQLRLRSDVVRAMTLVAEADGALSGVIRAFGPLAATPRAVELVNARATDTAPVAEGPDDTYTFRFPAGLAAAGTRSLRLVPERGRGPRVGWPDDRTTPPLVRADERRPGWQRSPRGNVQVLSPRPRCQADTVQLTADGLRVTVTTDQLTAVDLETSTLASAVTIVPTSTVSPMADGRWLLTFGLRAPAWPEGAVRPLPSGRYELTVHGPRGDSVVTAGADLLERLPAETVGPDHGLTVNRAPRSTRLQLTLRAPLGEGERARADQHRLQRRYADTTFRPAEQVLFQCYRGESATDSQVALHEELRRRDAPLDLVWGIADWSVELPDGARGVLVGSQAWYEALGRSRYLCSNIDFDRFLRRRPWQRFLQTFHGYPFKSMGIPFWRSKGFSERAIAEECDRRNRAWTSILVPAPFCVDLYRECYRYDGEILVTGYPRDDALVRPAAGVRDRVLRSLGVPAGRRVILYAPTWRESDTVSARKARLFDELELDRLADALGADHTVLLRGHTRTRHTSGAGATDRAEIVDVTRYPEINDLILAADVAVLDYSSLRFDWMLTGKPVLFFVPDLEDYLAQRSALFDFGPTAPGPLLRTTDEVVDALRGLDEVSAAFAPERAAADARFNGLNDGFAAARVVDAFFTDHSPTGG